MDEAHVHSNDSQSIVKLGRCKITDCTCRQYLEPIQRIDEDLL